MFAGKIPSQDAYSIAADGSVSKTKAEASKLNNVLVAAYGAGVHTQQLYSAGNENMGKGSWQ